MSIGGRGLALILMMGFAGACAANAKGPNYGSLQRGDRPFKFSHDIVLVETANGLKVALIRDPRSNLATVDMRYAVGAAEDPAGRTGLAHLVEHLLFELRAEPGEPTLGDRMGTLALYQNASTSWDGTTFRSQVAIEHLDEVLQLESDRMAARCDQLDDATFERERDVVLAETAGRGDFLRDLDFRLLTIVYGADHPYAHPLGNAEVKNATKAETCRFMADYYGPNRAYLVVTGPIDVEHLRGVIGRAFGNIHRTAEGDRTPIRPPHLDGGVTAVTAAVDHPVALVYLPYPAWGGDGTVTYRIAQLELSRALATADAAHDWISATSVTIQGGDRAPVMVAAVQVKSAKHLQAAAREVFARTAHMFDTLDRVDATQIGSAMTLGYLASWDDQGSRGAWIADFLQYTTHNWFMLRELRTVANLDWKFTIESLLANLGPDHAHVVLVTPGQGLVGGIMRAVPSGTHDLDPWRAPVDPAEAEQPLAAPDGGLGPRVERYQLANGLTVELAPDDDSPLVDARLVFPSGRAHDPADKPLLADATVALLRVPDDVAPGPRGWDHLIWALTRGTATDEEVTETATTFSARGLSQWGDWHVWYLSWYLQTARVDRDTFDRLHGAARKSADDEDPDVDLNVAAFNQRLFGAGHPYARPAPRADAAFAALTYADLEDWRARHLLARSATLIVSGAFDVDEMKLEIAELFGAWPDTAPAVNPPVPPLSPPDGPSWLADDNREANQVTVTMGFAAGSDPLRDAAARRVLVQVLEDRLRDVRERLGASYGVHADYREGAAGSALVVRGDLDEGKAGVGLQAILASVRAVRDQTGDQRAAFVRARRAALAEAAVQIAGASAIADQLEARAAEGLGYDALDDLAAEIAALTPAALARVAALDLPELHMVVDLEGRTPAIDAAFAAIGVTPERPRPAWADDDDAPTDEPDPVDAPPAAPVEDEPTVDTPRVGPREAALPLGTADDVLEVGTKFNVSGPREDGVYQGGRKISLDAFLRISGHGDVADGMRQRWWAKRGLIGGGIALALGGIAYGVTRGTCPDPGNGVSVQESDACNDRISSEKLRGATAIGLGGLLAFLGIELGHGRPTIRALQTYAASYNRRRGIRPADHGVYDVRLAPAIDAASTGLTLSGRF